MFNAAEDGKTLRTTMKGGTGNGLEIMLDIQQDEYLPVWGDTGRSRLNPKYLNIWNGSALKNSNPCFALSLEILIFQSSGSGQCLFFFTALFTSCDGCCQVTNIKTDIALFHFQKQVNSCVFCVSVWGLKQTKLKKKCWKWLSSSPSLRHMIPAPVIFVTQGLLPPHLMLVERIRYFERTHTA